MSTYYETVFLLEISYNTAVVAINVFVSDTFKIIRLN